MNPLSRLQSAAPPRPSHFTAARSIALAARIWVACLPAVFPALASAGDNLRTAAPGKAPTIGGARGSAVTLSSKAIIAANAFLATLGEAQRTAVVFAFDDNVQRAKWSNLPSPMFRHAGLRLGDLTAAQRNAALAVVAAVLSQEGYDKAIAIMEADETLKTAGAPGNVVFGRDEFFISFVGTPSMTAPWMLQFGGHHLAINVTIRGSDGVMTPSLIATQPATYTRDGKTVRPMGTENDLSFALINSLDSAQRSQAILGSTFHDLVLGPGNDGKKIVPEGVKVSTFTGAQQTQLLELVHQWVGMLDDAAAAARMTEIQANLADTWFVWSGPTTPGSAAYFRIQGPTVVIEYAPQQLGGSAVNHIHSMYRDPTNEYGRKFSNP